MGVPALFRWLSKKYPKIIFRVDEEEEAKITNDDGQEITIPIDMSQPNPNGVEFDNLYLDMNGIVHPCTHPEGKPAPETEEEMMIEVFKYTERVVNMVRPRRVLFLAIDGVAPRAKMNQQRSRRFRSAQEAKEKEEARKESLALWEAMGKPVSEEDKKDKLPWDSNAITPGTPFMHLLASSLRYWIVHKINSDPGWKNIQVILSDASVPGEGEHKIMDFIRCQRSNSGHDPNTRHVIYGLDADLIMLSLATHEPNFRVLREDVFANDTNPAACRMCGQEGHYAANCPGGITPVKKPPPERKPFIFLDVSILREYLEVELNIPQLSFPSSLEQAIDDWVLLIFFVGNDFLPHLPSLEIREGAIDTLLKIWKQELPRMGGYLTNHGRLELSRAQIILEGLARREDEIFRKRREAEERQDQNAKRRKLESSKQGIPSPSPAIALTANPTAPSPAQPVSSVHPSLPPRPSYDFIAKADSIGLGAASTPQSIQHASTATQALAGSNHDVVANRRAIRMANLSHAEVLRAEISGATALNPVRPLPLKPLSVPPPDIIPNVTLEASPMTSSMSITPTRQSVPFPASDDSDEVPGLGSYQSLDVPVLSPPTPSIVAEGDNYDANGEAEGLSLSHDAPDEAQHTSAGKKRKFSEGPSASDESDELIVEDEDDAPSYAPLTLKVNPDGTVEQEDMVKLWEPGYKERYYRQKFQVELTDLEFRNKITKHYVEGLAWVLMYYYQGTPSWQWFYPYHFAPFAADFEEIDKMDMQFDLGIPFKPFEQLLGVFPAASRKHLPAPFQSLMIDENSPIIDFYPTTFEIDMNGKRMAWQGVALLPFIDQQRLLDAMKPRYAELTEDEMRRNQWGNNLILVSDQHPLYPFYEALYGKRRNQDPVPIDCRMSFGINGSALRNPDCLPGSTYYSPLTEQDLPDIKNDCSLSAFYFFPKQLTPHRSILLPGVKRGPRILTQNDMEVTRSGGRGRGGWERNSATGRGGNWANGGADRGRGDPFHARLSNHGPGQMYHRGDGGPGRGGYGMRNGSGFQQLSYPSRQSYPPHTPQQYGGYGGYPPSRPPQNYGGYGSANFSPPAYTGYGEGHHSGPGGYGGYGGPGAASYGYGASVYPGGRVMRGRGRGGR